MKKLTIFGLFLLIFFVSGSLVWAQTGIVNTNPVSQNFDSITATALPANWKMSSAGTGATSGWATATNVTAATASASSGTPTAGGRYVWAVTGGTEKSIGFMTSGSYASPNAIMAYYQNQTGSTISDLAVNFQFERYRINSAAASVTFFTSTDGTNFTARAAGDIATTDFPTGTNAYTFGTPTTVAKTVTLTGVNVPANGDFYLRWLVNTTGSNSQGIGLDDVSVTATLALPPTISIDDVVLNEGNSGTTQAVFTVSLSSPAPAGGVTFDIATSDGTATSAGNDYTPVSLTAQIIPQGNLSYTFTVDVLGDTTVEANEIFFVDVTNFVGATKEDTTGFATILSDDTAFDLEFLAYTQDESQTMTVSVFRSGDLSVVSTVDFSTSLPGMGGNLGASAATAGATCMGNVDFIAQSGTLTFAVDEMVQTFSVPICSDQATESVETFPVSLSNPTNGILGSNLTVFATINDAASQYVSTALIGFPSSGDTTGSDLVVNSAPTSIGNLRVTLFDVEHFDASNMDVLLVGPQGQKMLLMADAGNGLGLVSPATLTFSDAAAQVLTQNGEIVTGVYEPTTWEAGQTNFSSPAPVGPYVEPGSEVGGAVTLASTFGGTNPNGTWSLYVRDDLGSFQPLGINGSIAGGWGLQFAVPTAAGVSVEGRVSSGKNGIGGATVTISGGNLPNAVSTRTNQFGSYRFEVLAAGQTYVVTVGSRRYSFTQPTQVVNVNDDVTNIEFTANER